MAMSQFLACGIDTSSEQLAAHTTPADPGVFAGYQLSVMLTDQLIKGVALAPPGLDREPPGLYRKRYGGVGTKRKRIEHVLGNRKHNGAANFSKPRYVRHGMSLHELFRILSA